MSSIDISAISQDASSVIGAFGLGLPGLVILLLIWASIRTGSHHLLLSRVWLLIFGKTEVGDPIIEASLSRRDAFMKFRLVTGLKPRTMAHVSKLIDWCEFNEEDLGDVKACGPFFNLEVPGLKPLPGIGADIARFVVLIVSTLLASSFITLATVAPAMFKVNKSERWYFVGEQGARRIDFLHPDSRKILLSNSGCGANSIAVASEDSIGQADARVLCELTGKPGQTLRDNALVGQRWLFGACGAAILFIAGLMFQAGLQHKAAEAMLNRLKARESRTK